MRCRRSHPIALSDRFTVKLTIIAADGRTVLTAPNDQLSSFTYLVPPNVRRTVRALSRISSQLSTLPGHHGQSLALSLTAPAGYLRSSRLSKAPILEGRY